MADAAVSMLLDPLISTINEWVNEEISLIKNVKPQLLKRVSFKLGNIQKFLHDAEKRSVTEETVKNWVDELKDISYNMEDVIDEWTTSLSKRELKDQRAHQNSKISCSTSLFTCVSPFKQVGLRHDIGSKIKNIDERLDFVLNNMNVFKFDVSERSNVVDSVIIDRVTTSIVNESKTYGRDLDEETILSKLLSEGTSSSSSLEVNRKIHVISVVGVGGLGKTTLAQLVFNNHEVIKNFSKRIWVCVSDPFDMDKVARDIIEAIKGDRPQKESSRDLLLKDLKESISNVKFLLVLDDVWDEEGRTWDHIRNCLEDCIVGSRVLVTTRKEKVAKVMGTNTTNIHQLEKLSEEACWSLFSQIAFSYDEEKKDFEKLEKIGRGIVKRCKGLPLAVRVLANVLCFKNTVEEWENILESEIWKIEKVDVELFPHFYLSYNELAPPIKRCFSYCSIFSKDTKMDVDELIRMWMAQGYVTSTNGEDDMESKGKGYFDKLAMSCFFQEFEKDGNGKIVSCKMHDIVHDFAQNLTRTEITVIANNIEKTFHKNTRHADWSLSTQIETDEPPLTIRDDVGNLRSLFIRNYSPQQPGGLMNNLKCVRSLILEGCNLEKIPKEIGSLIHLRLLNLAQNMFLFQLPKSVCELYNLQTLNIEYCFNLKILPKAIGKLINLRHLLSKYSGLEIYPKSFERLTSLRTLPQFKIGKIYGTNYGKLEYLKNLKHLGSKLEIEIDCKDMEVTEMVSDAQKSQLINNKYIQHLKLRFVDNDDAGVHDALLEALIPPHNLTHLTIENFKGRQYPSWLSNKSHFKNLRRLSIEKLSPNCSTLPPLWKLPYLETLKFKFNDNIKHIGWEFLGIEDSSINSASPILVAFPKLVELIFSYFEEWEEWEDLNGEHDDDPSIQIMPRLQNLKLLECKKLKQLPHRLLCKATSLEYLKINDCGINLNNCQQQVEQLLSHIPKIQVDDIIYTPDNPFRMAVSTPDAQFYLSDNHIRTTVSTPDSQFDLSESE